MSAASLALLKGGKADEAKAEDTQASTETEVETEEVTVEIETMTGKQLDDLVKEHEIEVPATWKKMKVEEKRDWLNKNVNQDEATEEAAAETETEVEAEAQTEEPAPAPAPAPTKVNKVVKTTKAKLAEAAVEPPKADEAKPAEKKTVTKSSKTKATKEAGDDPISNLVNEVENLKEDEARKLVTTLADDTDLAYIKMGGVLSVIQSNGWFAPYASFREYVEGAVGMDYRKGNYLVAIYNHLAQSGIPYSKVAKLGWTKLKELASVLTKENVDKWVKEVEGKTTLQIIQMVKNAKAADAGVQDQQGTSVTVTTKTFKVHEDQKKTIEAALEKAREATNTTVDTVALEYICTDYLGGTDQSLKGRLAKAGLDAALEAFGEAFPNIALTAAVDEEESETAAA